MARLSRPRVLIGVVLLALVAAAVFATVARQPRRDGPLQTNSSVNISYPLPDGQIFVWGTTLPWRAGMGDVRIESIEPVGTRGIEVLGLVLNNSVQQPDGSCLAYGDRPTESFPPPDAPTREVSGAVLSAALGNGCSNHPSVLVGVRRMSDSAAGRIDSLRMRYEHQGITYELLMPYSLDVRRP